MPNLRKEEKDSKKRFKDVRVAIDQFIANQADRDFLHHYSLQPMVSPPREFVVVRMKPGDDPDDAMQPYAFDQEAYLLAAKMHYVELKGDLRYPMVEIPYQNSEKVLPTPEFIKDPEMKERLRRWILVEGGVENLENFEKEQREALDSNRRTGKGPSL